jgi:hypothetical protein
MVLPIVREVAVIATQIAQIVVHAEQPVKLDKCVQKVAVRCRVSQEPRTAAVRVVTSKVISRTVVRAAMHAKPGVYVHGVYALFRVVWD